MNVHPDPDPAPAPSAAAAAAGTTDETAVRTVTEAEFADWARASSTGFLRAQPYTADDLERRRLRTDLSRTKGAFEAGRCVATYRSFSQQLTVPGGQFVQANGVSSVTVSPTHRRRGILGRMIRADLAEAKERGDVVATLIAAEYPIYGRYGFGHATSATEWEIDVHRTGLDPRWARPECGGRIDLVDAADVRKTGPELHERFRAGQAGALDRDTQWWEARTGLTEYSFDPHRPTFFAVYRGPAEPGGRGYGGQGSDGQGSAGQGSGGQVQGLVAYRADDKWGDGKQPLNTVQVSGMTTTTPAAERALWRFLCSIDWVATVRTGYRAPDDLVPELLPDPRAARVVTAADWLWVRVLDVVRALEARTYTRPYEGGGSVVLEVRDRLGLAGGRFRLEVGADGSGVCAATTESAELSLDVRELGALYLGGRSAVRMAALGLVTEERDGVAARVDALFRTVREPWCPDVF